jgi:hypothetical protein
VVSLELDRIPANVQTKNGFTHPGTRAEAPTGPWSRHMLRAESGGTGEDLSYFITANHFDEDGRRGEDRSLELGVTYADTDLLGNGPAPEPSPVRAFSTTWARPAVRGSRPTWTVRPPRPRAGAGWASGSRCEARNPPAATIL